MDKKIKNYLVISPVVDSINFIYDLLVYKCIKGSKINIIYDSDLSIGYFQFNNKFQLINIKLTKRLISFSGLFILLKNIYKLKLYSNSKIIYNSPNSILYLPFIKILFPKTYNIIFVHGLLEGRSIMIRFIYFILLNVINLFSNKTLVVNNNYKIYLKPSVVNFIGIFGVGLPKNKIDYFINNKKERKNDEIIKIGFAGRYTNEKGFDRFLKIAKYANLKQMNYSFFAFGDKTSLVNNKVQSFGILKTNEELMNFYNYIDILIFPSRGEGTGLVQLEAILSGVKVFASDNNGSIQLSSYFKNNLIINKNWTNFDLIFKKIYNLHQTNKLILQNKLDNTSIFEFPKNIAKIL